jgi:hypothetical protein
MAIDLKTLPQSQFTQDQIIEMVADALGIPAANLNSESEAGDIVEWDSMGILCLLTVLDRHGVTFPPGDVTIIQSMQGVLAAFDAAGKLK